MLPQVIKLQNHDFFHGEKTLTSKTSFHYNACDLPPKEMCKIAGILSGAAVSTCPRSWQISWNSLWSIFAGQRLKVAREETVTATSRGKSRPTSRGVVCCFPSTLFCSLSAMEPARLLQIMCLFFWKQTHLSMWCKSCDKKHLECLPARNWWRHFLLLASYCVYATCTSSS